MSGKAMSCLKAHQRTAAILLAMLAVFAATWAAFGLGWAALALAAEFLAATIAVGVQAWRSI